MKRIFIAFLCAAVLLLNGCTLSEIINKGETTMSTEGYITPQELIDEFKLTGKDVEGIDLQAFIDEYELKKSDLDGLNIIKVIEGYKKSLHMDDYSLKYLFTGEDTASQIDLDNIAWLVLYENKGNLTESFAFNLKDDKSYYSRDSYIIENYMAADSILDISSQSENEMIAALGKADINNWKHFYTGHNDPQTTADYSWGAALMFNDGTHKSFGGSGAFGENKPDNFTDFVMEIRRIAQGQ